MENNTTIPEYVLDLLKGTATEQQVRQAKVWLKDPEHTESFNRIKKIVSLTGDLKAFEKYSLPEGRHSVQQKIRARQKIRFVSRVQKIAAMLLLPALICAGWLTFSNYNLKQEMVSRQIMQKIGTQPGIRSSFVLPDGSRVWLNSASTILFPSFFQGKTRTIELDGEAYFEVAHNPEKPFIVKSQNIHIMALGTAFNLCAYHADEEISATLAEGKVRISTGKSHDKSYILKPNEQLTLQRSNNKVRKELVNATDVAAWKDGKLIFNETPLQEVVEKLSRWFNTDIRLADKSIEGYRYTATFTNESLSQVMELLTFSAPIEFSTTQRQMQPDNNYSPGKIVIRFKPHAIRSQNTKTKMPMK